MKNKPTAQQLEIYQRWIDLSNTAVYVLFLEGIANEGLLRAFAPKAKHLILIVDLSDSCQTENPNLLSQIQLVFNSALKRLKEVDIYSIYILSMEKPLIYRHPASDPMDIPKNLNPHLMDTAKNGTWLYPTWNSMEKILSPEELSCIVILTDGEIWDIDACRQNINDSILGKDLRIGIGWIGLENKKADVFCEGIPSFLLESHEEIDKTMQAILTSDGDDQIIEDFSVQIHNRQNGEILKPLILVEYSDLQKLVEIKPETKLAKKADSLFRIAGVSQENPDISVSITLNYQDGSVPIHLEKKSLSALSLNTTHQKVLGFIEELYKKRYTWEWNENVIQNLKERNPAKVECPHCGYEDEILSKTRKACCHNCGSQILLSKKELQRDDPRLLSCSAFLLPIEPQLETPRFVDGDSLYGNGFEIRLTGNYWHIRSTNNEPLLINNKKMTESFNVIECYDIIKIPSNGPLFLFIDLKS